MQSLQPWHVFSCTSLEMLCMPNWEVTWRVVLFLACFTSISLCLARYSTASGQSSCSSCSPGFFSVALGVTVCAECQSGTYQSGIGSLNCTICENGRYTAVRGQSACSLCETGKYSTLDRNIVMDRCLDCPASSYQDQTGKSFCNLCQAGRYSSSSAQALCASCDAGELLSNIYTLPVNIFLRHRTLFINRRKCCLHCLWIRHLLSNGRIARLFIVSG